MSWAPHVTVAAVIRHRHRYLMVEEAPAGQRVINQPAGHLEQGETLVDAIKREVLEETGQTFSPEGLIGVYQWAVPNGDKTYLRFCFTGTVGDACQTATIDPDIIATHWLSEEQIRSGPLAPRSPLVLRCIEDARTRPPTALEILRAPI